MLTFKEKTGKENLILFIHGFIGGKDTWERVDGKQSIMNYLIDDQPFAKNFDFALFDYFTKVFDFYSKRKGWFARLCGLKEKNEKNLRIKDLADLLDK